MATLNIVAVPGQRIEVDVDPTGWPYRIGIGDNVASAFPDRYLHGRQLRARAHRTCPRLGAGTWPLWLYDRSGVRQVGTITIR